LRPRCNICHNSLNIIWMFFWQRIKPSQNFFESCLRSSFGVCQNQSIKRPSFSSHSCQSNCLHNLYQNKKIKEGKNYFIFSLTLCIVCFLNKRQYFLTSLGNVSFLIFMT
jgi:hypothetical protein